MRSRPDDWEPVPPRVIRPLRQSAGRPGEQLPFPPEVVAAIEGDEEELISLGSGHGGVRRWLGAAWLALPLAVAVAIVSSSVGGGGALAPGATPSTSTAQTTLPRLLVSVEADQNAGRQEWNIHVGPGTGFDVSSTFSLDAPVIQVEVGPAGDVAAIDERGDLHLFPGTRTVQGPIRTAAISPDGRFLAICRAETWPPTLTVVTMAEPETPLWPGVTGCDPSWSPDASYLAYHVPAIPVRAGVFSLDEFGVLNVNLDVRYRLTGAWPVAWSPAPGYSSTPLTVISAERDSVELMDPSGQRRQMLVAGETLRRLTGGRAFGPLELLAWSPDGERLAIGSAEGAAGFGLSGVAVLDPVTGDGAFVGAGYDPISLTWSVGQELLAEFEGPTGRLTRLVPKDAPFVELLDVGQASWAPDGRWILARTKEGWVAIDASAPQRRLTLGSSSSRWTSAVWCCPPISVATLGQSQLPAGLSP